MPPTVAPRRFGIADALILVAATAAGLAASRGIDARLTEGDAIWSRAIDLPQWARMYWGVMAMPMAAAWSLAALDLRRRRPHPSPPRLSRQPGWAATLAATLALLIAPAGTLGLALTTMGVDPLDDPTFLAIRLFYRATAFASVSVAVAWIALATSGRWRAEPTWIDRLGRLLGVYWIASIPISFGLA